MNEIGDHELTRRLESVAASLFDGHLTIMKFTTNWRVEFGTPFDRYDIQALPVGRTFADAARSALADVREAWRDQAQRRSSEAEAEATQH